VENKVETKVETNAVNRERIAETERRIRPYIRRTPMVEVDGADFGLGGIQITFKLELMQRAGAFKLRGAFANLLTRELPAVGVAAASGGNHGVAVAYAAKALGKPARIFVPRVTSPSKIERIRNSGAELVVTGELYADALAASEAWIAESGAMRVHAFDSVETLLGAGSVGLEFQQQAPELPTLLVPVGGGGLISGIASWYDGAVKIVGVEPEAAPTLERALAAGKPVDAPAGGIAADSLAPKRVGELNFPIAQKFVSQVVLVTDDAIARAQEALWQTMRVVAEPGGATAFSALLSGRYKAAPGERVGVVISGGNTTAVDFTRRAEKGA
jgi:threonine dehydratase